ncbi:RNA-binding protein 1-like protein [Cinnamomum micranthum f. kanehirae]|uniref:RNA-binding protein 1-like protein n=1 Tax=Cinnamomum micranthum f. kanehirae TaxID=337451 RepID=A0A443PDT8_9MAGN|nr:RNA-binding protein 1-like protein [Cinnamomum micranthum f. kanehirae]
MGPGPFPTPHKATGPSLETSCVAVEKEPQNPRLFPFSTSIQYIAKKSSSAELSTASPRWLRSIIFQVLPSLSGAFGLDNIAGIGSRANPELRGLTTGMSMKGYPTPLEDPIGISHRRDLSLGTPGIPDILPERSNLFRQTDGLPSDESNILFVDGLPSDCTRREVAHLFRPFIGFKEIRVIHKEPRRSGEKAVVLCFVEFIDAKCALTALEALQGYKFDDKKSDAPVLRIQFAHFPFRPSSNRDDRRLGSIH